MRTEILNEVPDRKHLRRARGEALGLSGLLLVISASAVLGLWIVSQRSERTNFLHYIVGLLQAAAPQIDVRLHERLRRPEQTNDPDYIRAVAPLVAMRRAVPDIQHLYTLAWDGQALHFVLDSDGPGDQVEVWGLFPSIPPHALQALGLQGGAPVAAVSPVPVTDHWGTFMAGFAPVKGAHGEVIAIVGLAVDARVYLENLRVARYRAMEGLVPAACLIVLLGFIFYRVRLKGLMLKAVLRDAAHRDKLTGLPNRRVFMASLNEALHRAREVSGTGFAVLFLDFDRFKMVNDTLGHECGDELLRQIAQRLVGELGTSNSRAGNCVVSRFGGDEFLILSNDPQDARQPAALAERVLKALARPYDLGGTEVHSLASIGIVTSEYGSSAAEEILRYADAAMYEAKHRGRGCYVQFDSQMHAHRARKAAIEASLRRVVGTPEMYLEYQPIVDLRTGACPYVEVLLRWQHPELGAIAPSEFIPIAEEMGFMVTLGDWILEESCRCMSRWRRADSAWAPTHLSVNISRAQLAVGAHLLAQIRAVLERTGLPPECLQLEVTECEVDGDPRSTRELLLQLREMRIKLALDDFGAGTASLSLLRTCPFDLVKLDRAFLQDLHRDETVVAIVHATLQLVENLGMTSVAQGVENAVQLGILQSMGCRLGQGFFLAPSVSTGRMVQGMAQGSAAALSGR